MCRFVSICIWENKRRIREQLLFNEVRKFPVTMDSIEDIEECWEVKNVLSLLSLQCVCFSTSHIYD